MYKVKCTGLNKNYGEKDEIRLVADNYINVGLRNKWFEVISYEGSAKADTLYSIKIQLENIDRDIQILELKKKLLKEKLARREQ